MNPYTRDFQINLIAHLARDLDLFQKTHTYLRLTDFDLPACQLVLETLSDYYRKIGTIPPDTATLQIHVLYMMQQPLTATSLIPEEYASLAYVLEVISKISVNTIYYTAQLPEYLKFIRTIQAVDANAISIRQGQGVEEFLAQLGGIDGGIGTSSRFVIDSMTANPEPILAHEHNVRIPSGLTKLDKFTGRGLGLGEIGMITACPGVGKTTSLINFMVGGMGAGHRALFLTLELSGKRIKHRYQSIAAYINASWLKLPVPQWPEEEMRRYQYILDKNHRHFDKVQIVDMSKSSFTCNDINIAIRDWKDQVDKKYDDADNCHCVYVDWLDRIDPSGLVTAKSDRDDKVLVKIAETLGMYARQYDVSLWTATQGTREADGQELLRMKHTAYGYHKNDPLDVSLGLGPIERPGAVLTAQAKANMGNDDDNELAPACDRELMFNIMKNRDNKPGSVPLYQGDTLKYWDNKEDSDAMRNVIAEGGLRALQERGG